MNLIEPIGSVTFGKGVGVRVFPRPDSDKSKGTTIVIVCHESTSFYETGVSPDVLKISENSFDKTLSIRNKSELAKYGSANKSPVKPLIDVLLKETEV